MPRYMMLIYGPTEGGPSPEELAAQMPRWGEYTEKLKQSGLFLAGEALEGAEVATTVRVRGGETQITDGPFAETKELLGGYYLVQASDLDTVLEHAARMPNIEYGSVEVRPIWEIAGAPEATAAGQAQAS
jgi:hypothetical protein